MRPRRDSGGNHAHEDSTTGAIGHVSRRLVGRTFDSSERSHQPDLWVAVLDTTGACPPPPVGYEDFTDFTQVMTGDLDGCWYTNIETTKDNGAPSGVYIESGKEIFVGSLNGGPDGTFSTTYKFESKWDRTCRPAQRSTDVAPSAKSLRAAAPAALTVPPAELTSRTKSQPDSSSTGATSSSGSHLFQPKCCPGPTERFPSMALLRAAGP